MNAEFSESAIPLDESGISKTFEKESKKLLRMPFYKREELKKQEERKQKNKNHYHQHKKKEETVKIEKKDNKYKKIIKKKDEPPKTIESNTPGPVNPNNKQITTNIINNNEHKPVPNANETLNLKVSNKKNDLLSFNTILNKIEETDDEFNREKFIEKKVKNKPALAYSGINVNEGDFMKKIKYENREVKTQKFRLSKKQRRLQEGENTLASFLTKEDKQSLFVIDEKVRKKHKTMKKKETTMNNNNNINNLTEKNDLKTTINNNNEIVVKGKRRKRINKFKKAIYRYRYQKKKFILENILKLQETAKVESSINHNKLNTNILKEEEEEKKLTIEEIKQNINLNQETIVKPNLSGQNLVAFNENYSSVNNTKYANNQISHQDRNSYHSNINKYNYNIMYNPSFSNYMNPYYYPMQIQQNYNYPSYINYYNNFSQPSFAFYNSNNFNQSSYSNINDNYRQKPYSAYLNHSLYNKDPLNKFPNREDISNKYKNSCNKESINIPPFKLVNQYSSLPNYIVPKIANYQNTTFQKAPKKKKKKAFKPNKAELINLNNHYGTNQVIESKKNFIFEQKLNEDLTEEELKQIDKQELIKKIKESYNLDVDLEKLEGEDFNNYLKEHKDLKRISLKQLEKISNNKSLINEYIKNFEGLQPGTNYNRKIVREYVDQILSPEFDKKFSEFVEKIREMYFKKKQTNPLKAKKRYVVGMREVEKFIRLDETKCIFIIPNIEKVEGKNSLDERLLNIINSCRNKNIPVFYGLNKFKLGKVCRKKFSSVSILSIINVESLDQEFRNLVQFGETFKKKFYEKYDNQRETFKDNKFIPEEMFEIYRNKDKKI